jgi:hypothetical protein
MRNLLLFFPLSLLIACGGGSQNDATNNDVEQVVDMPTMNFYGDSISAEGAVAPSDFLAQMNGVDSLPIKIEAKINQTCRMKGCWMTLDMGNGEEMRVSFKDYGFFVPTEGVDGKTAIIEGFAYPDTTSVEHLQHLAEDAGKSPEEIAQITEPEVGVSFEAHGVIIKN